MMNNAFIKDFKLTEETVNNINKVIEILGCHETRFHDNGFTGGMIIGKKIFYFDSEIEKHGYDYGIIVYSIDEYDRRVDERRFAISDGELWDIGEDGSMAYEYCPIDDEGYSGWFWLTLPMGFKHSIYDYVGQLFRQLAGC